LLVAVKAVLEEIVARQTFSLVEQPTLDQKQERLNIFNASNASVMAACFAITWMSVRASKLISMSSGECPSSYYFGTNLSSGYDIDSADASASASPCKCIVGSTDTDPDTDVNADTSKSPHSVGHAHVKDPIPLKRADIAAYYRQQGSAWVADFAEHHPLSLTLEHDTSTTPDWYYINFFTTSILDRKAVRTYFQSIFGFLDFGVHMHPTCWFRFRVPRLLSEPERTRLRNLRGPLRPDGTMVTSTCLDPVADLDGMIEVWSSWRWSATHKRHFQYTYNEEGLTTGTRWGSFLA
jgi:hypothetical protein